MHSALVPVTGELLGFRGHYSEHTFRALSPPLRLLHEVEDAHAAVVGRKAMPASRGGRCGRGRRAPGAPSQPSCRPARPGLGFPRNNVNFMNFTRSSAPLRPFKTATRNARGRADF